MKVKVLEIRDAATFIPVLCIEMKSEQHRERWLLARLGFGSDSHLIEFVWIGNGRAEYDPFKWGGRTMPVAHKWIEEHWEEIESGDVIDVEYILGEKETKKISERENG